VILFRDLNSESKKLWHLATRYDKKAVNFLGSIYLAASVIWLI
jgi:transposase